MLKYFIKRLLQLIPMLLVISILIFIGMQFMPVDPINAMIPPDSTNSVANRQALEEVYGLNEPLYLQYLKWLGRMLKGDFGYSIITGQAINQTLLEKMPATLQLSLAAFFISSIVGILLGILSARFPNSWIDNLSRIIIVIGDSVPEFLIGILLIYIFALKLDWLPASGRLSYGENPLISSLRSLILPATALALGMISTVLRYTRSSVMTVMNQDYIKTARSKGLHEWKVYFYHGFRNALGPVLVILIFRIPGIFGGSVIIESVFSWPGMGAVIMGAVSMGDYPVVLATTLLLATIMLVMSFMLDIINAWLNPKVRVEE